LGRIVAKGEKEDGPEVEVKSNCSSGYSLRFAGFPCSLGAAFALLSSEDLAPVMIDQPEPDHVEHALDASRTAGVDVKRPLRFPMDAEAADKAHCVGEYQNNRYSRPDSLRCVHHQRPVATRLCRGVSSASSIARVDTGRLIAKKYTRWQCRTIAMTAESEEPSDDPSFLLGRLVPNSREAALLIWMINRASIRSLESLRPHLVSTSSLAFNGDPIRSLKTLKPYLVLTPSLVRPACLLELRMAPP
jgi:hypothetical protein